MQPARDTAAKPREDPGLAGIPDRIGIGVEAQARHEPDRRAETADLFEPDIAQGAALESIDLACRHTGRSRDLATTQASGDSAHAELASRGLGEGSCGCDGSIEATISYGHC
jgi:hypothetical protein